MRPEQMLELAEQQITGFVHRDNGGTIEDLAQSMGLSKNEWNQIKRKNTWIPENLKIDLDNFFK